MSKILDKAIITKCGDCRDTLKEFGACYCCNPFFNEEKREVNPGTIDKDCPLQDCEVIENRNTVGEMEYFLENVHEIDYIVIVKKRGE